MDLTNETAHRALAFVAAVVDQGYYPALSELELYSENPVPRGGTVRFPGLLKFVETYQQAMGGQPPEKAHQWLLRIEWLREGPEEARVDITPLGRAVLRALNRQEVESDVALQVTLEPSDSLAYAKVIGRIAQQGQALLVDPYFKMEHILHIIQQTDVDRILVGEQLPKNERAQLAAAVDSLDIDRPFEIRMASRNEMHDRFVIPESGPVETMGTSLTGVGKKLTVMQSINPPTADGIRDSFLKIWVNAEVLARSDHDETSSQ